MSTNTRKNKNNVPIVWSEMSYFTVEDLAKVNPQIPVVITLRTRLIKAIEKEGKAAEIGSIPGGKGRPKKIYALTPITETVLAKAEADGITLVEKAREKLVNVISVTDSHFSFKPEKPVMISIVLPTSAVLPVSA